MKSNLLKKHAKSFYWASFFLSSNTLEKCSSLYNFCRTLDDIVDDDKNLIGIAKVATPVRKTEDKQYTFKLKIDI